MRKISFSSRKKWQGKFGEAYSLGNPLDIKDVNKKYLENYGITRAKLNKEFIGRLNR